MKQKVLHYGKIFITYALAFIFGFASFLKLTGNVMEVELFTMIGVGMWFMYFVGSWELLGALLTLTKAYRKWGLALIALTCVGAFIAQVAIIHMDWIHTVVLGSLAGYLAYREHKKSAVV